MSNAINRNLSPTFVEENLDENVVILDTAWVTGDNDNTNLFVIYLGNSTGNFCVNAIYKSDVVANEGV